MHANILHAQVVSQDPDKGSLNVMVPSGEISGTFPAQMLYHGYADAVRISQPPMPVKGTVGLVALIFGAVRNAVWLGSVYVQGADARTHPTDPDADYDAHHSGAYEIMDGVGNWTKQFADGTFIVVGSSATPIQTQRHIVDQTQTRQSTNFTNAERCPSPPSPFHAHISLASGVSIDISPAGAIVINLPGTETFSLTQGGASATDALALVSKLVTWLSTHTHNNVQTGGGVSGTPTQAITATTIQSAIAKTSG